MYTYIRQNVQIKYPRAALFLGSLRVDHANIHRDVPIFTTREVMVLSVDLIISLVWSLQAATRYLPPSGSKVSTVCSESDP